MVHIPNGISLSHKKRQNAFVTLRMDLNRKSQELNYFTHVWEGKLKATKEPTRRTKKQNSQTQTMVEITRGEGHGRAVKGKGSRV